jgi:Leucine-rich repeat (LRR) protein
MNDIPNLERVELTNCPNLVCLPALDNSPRLGSLVLRLPIKELPQSFTRRGAFPTLKLFYLGHSRLAEFPEVEEGAMPNLRSLYFDDCTFLHTLPASISLLTSISTIDLGSTNEKLINFCKANFTNSPIWKRFNVNGKPLILEEEVFELAVPMEEGTIPMQGNEKRPFQKVHGDDEDRSSKCGGSGFLVPSYPKRSVYFASSSATTKIEKEHSLLCQTL